MRDERLLSGTSSPSQGAGTSAEPGDGLPWINPIGGYGDMLMLSGVLKHVHDLDPARRFNLVRRTNYQAILKGHPSIAGVGFPPKGAAIVGVNYWAMERLGPGNQRAYQVLARAFGLPTPVEERLYLPGELEEDPLLDSVIPWKACNVAIAPASDSPRKAMAPALWHRVVDALRKDGSLVLQLGRTRDVHIRNAISLLGLTTPRQAIRLLRRCDLLITSDNFLMHAAHLLGKPAVVLWGATQHSVYGYPEHVHIQMARTCGLPPDEDCIGPLHSDSGRLYATPCPMGERHCLDQVLPGAVYEAARAAVLRAPR